MDRNLRLLYNKVTSLYKRTYLKLENTNNIVGIYNILRNNKMFRILSKDRLKKYAIDIYNNQGNIITLITKIYESIPNKTTYSLYTSNLKDDIFREGYIEQTDGTKHYFTLNIDIFILSDGFYLSNITYVTGLIQFERRGDVSSIILDNAAKIKFN